MEKVSVIIPCYPPHLVHLHKCFGYILNQTILPYEVILAVSQTNQKEALQLEKDFSSLFVNKDVKFKVSYSRLQKWAGQNRNRGAGVACGDILMFCDVDDQISKYKVEFCSKILQMHNADMIMHKFAYKQPLQHYKDVYDANDIDIENIKITKTEDVHRFVFQNGRRDRDREVKYGSYLCKGHPPGITMGYATIRRTVFDKIKYSNLRGGEDLLFFKDCLWAGFNVILMEYALINYLPSEK